jgi:3',5'-cyclic AMP phosphodiesterase CpdA
VDDCSAQLTWRASPDEDLTIEVGDCVARPAPSPQVQLVLGASRRARPLDPAWPAGAGSVVVDGLSPATTYDVVATGRGIPRFLAGRLRTLPVPGERLLCKFATVSDVHIGETHFGILGRIHDALDKPAREGTVEAEPYPVRALRAAIDETVAWGAELIVAKGDLTTRTVPAEVRDAGRLLTASPVPVEALLGNHDNELGVDSRAILEKEGLAVPWVPQARDLPGVRLVLVNTVQGDPRYHRGQLPPEMSRRVAQLAAESPAGTLVVLHHPPELHRFPTVYPPGIPFGESRQLLDGLVAAKPAALVTCGHRHRNRRYGYGPLVVSEVSATKDYPGVWAGYKVYDGGVVQVVRRISRPDVISWTEATRRAMNGQWHRWSPGRVDDRCFAVSWTRH